MWGSRLLSGGVASLIGGRKATASGSQSSGPGTVNGSPPTCAEIDGMANLMGLEEMSRQNRHAMSMAQAQLREQLGKNWQEPDDVAINWNSPTILNHPEAGIWTVAKMAVAAALLGGGIVLGSAMPWLLGNLSSGAADVVAPSDSDTQYRLGLGEPDE
jgi:hypothetical protein